LAVGSQPVSVDPDVWCSTDDEEVDVWATVIRGSNVEVFCVVPLVVGVSVLAGNVSSAASFPDHLRSVDKMCPDSHLTSVLLMGVVAAVEAEGGHGWLVLPEAAALLWDVVFNAEELSVCVADGESDLTASANVL